jgi:hypothetical protein
MNLQKEGIVYTPENITNFIAKTTIDQFLIDKISNKFSTNIIDLDLLFEKYIQGEAKESTLIEDSTTINDKEQFKYICKVLKNIKVLDPSVGKGDFIFAALKVLESYFIRLKLLRILDWSYYQIRKFIISNTLYGVDIETDAVHKTKQRLLLALTDLIDDLNDSADLPNIDSNFKVGNALVGVVRISETSIHKQNNVINTFYDEIKNVFHSHKDLRKIDISNKEKETMIYDLKPFHWFKEFPDVISSGGFDIIIQNPPYISNKQLSPLEKAIFEDRFKTPKGLMNTFGMFIERSIDLCHPSSRISNIIHKNIIRSNNYDLLRKFLLECTTIEEIIDLGAKAFQSVTAETVVIILKPKPPSVNHKVLIKTKSPDQKHFTPKKVLLKDIFQNVFLEQENYNINLNLQYKELEIISFIKKNNDCELVEFFEAKTCIATGDDDKFLGEHKINEKYKKTLRGKNIGRYYIDFDNLYIYYHPKMLHRARDERIFLQSQKLIMQTISSKLTVAYDDQVYYPLSTCIVIIPKDSLNEVVSIKYLLLFMNSKLVNFYYDFVYNLGAYLTTEISVNNINKLPLILPEEYEIFNIVSEVMVQLNKSNKLREQNQDFIKFFDNLINFLIYEVVFTYKTKLDSFNTSILNQVSNYLIEVNVNSMKDIKEGIINIQNDKNINREIQLIRSHPWVKIIEDYFSK